MPPKKRNTGSKGSGVFDRLTNTKLYTGAHKARFNEDGSGRGIAGRRNVVDFKGSTNTKTVESTTPKKSRRRPVVKPGLGKKKFGTQKAKSKVVFLFKNGDKNDAGLRFVVKDVLNLNQLLERVSFKLKLVTGACRKLVNPSLKSRVRTLDDLKDGYPYIACGGEKVDRADLPKRFLAMRRELRASLAGEKKDGGGEGNDGNSDDSEKKVGGHGKGAGSKTDSISEGVSNLTVSKGGS